MRAQSHHLLMSGANIAHRPRDTGWRGMMNLTATGWIREEDCCVRDEQPQSTLFGAGSLFFEAARVANETSELYRLPEGLRQRVTFDENTHTLTVRKFLTDQDKGALEACFATAEGKGIVETLYRLSHGRPAQPEPQPADRGRFRVPMLAIRVDGQLGLFEEGHFLDKPWKLSECDNSLTEAELPVRQQ